MAKKTCKYSTNSELDDLLYPSFVKSSKKRNNVNSSIPSIGDKRGRWYSSYDTSVFYADRDLKYYQDYDYHYHLSLDNELNDSNCLNRISEERLYDSRDRSCSSSSHVEGSGYILKRNTISYHDDNDSQSYSSRSKSSREPSVSSRATFSNPTSTSNGSRNVSSSTGLNNFSDVESYCTNSASVHESSSNPTSSSSSHHHGTSSGSYQNLPGASSTQDNLSTSSSHSNDREDRQTTAICVRNFPIRSTDSNIKDGLYHEFKKYGRVAGVRVYGQSSERYAIVFFKKPEETERALSDSKDKQFFGIRIEVSPCDNLETEDNDFKPNETELDEYHPRATRTLFVGNLDKDVSSSDLAIKFGQFGEILEIDIKNQNQPYAFIQFTDISSVVKAMRKCDGETMGSTRLKLGFGKSFSTSCIWLCDTSDAFSDEKALLIQMKRYGMVKNHVFVRDQRSALIFYENSDDARKAVEDLRCKSVNGRKIQVDFASRDFQAYFLGKHAKPDDTHRGRSSGSVGSWIGNSNLDYEDRMYDNSRARSISYHHQSTSRSASSVITSQHLRTNSNGGATSYSSRQRSPSPTSSPATLSTFGSFSRNSVSQSNSSSLHGSSRLSKYDYHHDSSSRLSSRQPYRYDIDDVDDICEDSHLSSSSKRESSRYRHHLSENYLSESSPKVRRESSPYCSYPNSTNKLDQEFHRSSRSSTTDELKPHDEGHGSLRRTSSNHSKSYHKSGRDSPPLPPTLSTQFRKSGLASSSSSSSSSSRSPIRDLKSSSHYQDRNSPSPSTSPKANAYSYHDSDRLNNDSSVIELSKVDKDYNSLNQWRRKSTEDSAYNRDFLSSDIQARVRSESISESSDNFPSLNSHRDYPRDRIRESHLNRSNSTLASPTSLAFQDTLKRKLDSDDASADLSGHLERKKRLLACIEQSYCSTNSQTLTAPTTSVNNLIGTNSATIAVSNISKNNNLSAEQQRITSSKSVDSAELNGSKQQQTKLRDPRESNLGFLIKRRSSSSSSSSSVVNNSSHHSLSNSGGNTAPIIDLKAKNEVVLNLFEQVLGEGVISNEQAVAVLSLLNQNQDSKTSSNPLSRSKQLSTTSLGGQSVNSSSKSKVLVKENSLGQHLKVNEVANSVVKPLVVDPRSSNARYWKWMNRTSCDNDLNKLKPIEANSVSAVTSSSHSKSQNEYGLKSPMSLPLPDFALPVNRSSSSTDSKSNHSASSVVIACSTTATTSLTTTTTTTSSNTTSLININIPTFSTSPKSTNIMSPLGNHSPVPKSRLSRDRMSADINSLDTKKLSTDLDDVSDSDVSPHRTTSFEAQIKALDEKYNAWSGTTSTVLPIKSEKTPTIDYSKYNIKKKSQVNSGSVSVNNISITNTLENESSDIIKNLLSKSSVFDQDSKRLEHINEKYEPKDISSIDLESILSSPKSKTNPRIKIGSNNKDLSPPLTNSFPQHPASTTTSHATPTEKVSLESMPKPAPISTSVSSSLHNSSSHHLNHHHHSLTSSSSTSSSSITISTSISSMTRKLSDPSRIYSIKKDSSVGPTSNSTPNTPNSAPVRSISSSMFPQFSRSSSIPITSTPTTTTSLSRNSFQHNSTLNKKDNLFAVSKSANTLNFKSEKSKPELTSPKPTLPSSASKDSIKKEKDPSTTPKLESINKHSVPKPDYLIKSKHSDSIEHNNAVSSSDNEHLFKEQTKLKNDIQKYSKESIKEEVKEKDSKKHDKEKERDKVERSKIERLNELNHHDSNNQHSVITNTPKESKDKKSDKILTKEKKNKNKDKSKDVDYFNRDSNTEKEYSTKDKEIPTREKDCSNVDKESTKEKEHANKSDKESCREKEHSKDKDMNRERNHLNKELTREKEHHSKDKEHHKEKDHHNKESNRDKEISSKESSRDKSHKESTREKSHLTEKEMNRVREHIKNTKSKMEKREKSEYKEKSRNSEKKNKHREKKDGRMKQSEINELLKIAGCEPIYFSMYDKVKARSSANQSLKGSNVNDNVRQKLGQLKDKRHRRDDDDDDEDDEDKNSSQDSESDSDSSLDEMIQNQKRFNLMKKRRAMINSSDSSSDEEINLKKPKKSISTDMIISDSESDVPSSKPTEHYQDDERKKKTSQSMPTSNKKNIGFSSDDSIDFSILFSKSGKSSKYIKKFNEMITDDSSDNDEKIKSIKKKKKLKKEKDKSAELLHCSSKDKSESNDKVEKVKEHQKLKKSKADKKDKERDSDKPKCDKEKRIKSEDEDPVKMSKFYKKKKKKTKSSKEKKHSKEEYKQQAEQNRVSKRDVPSDQDNLSDSSDLDDIMPNKKNLSMLNNSLSDSENEMRSHMIKCYSKEKEAKNDLKSHKVDKEHLKEPKEAKSGVNTEKLEKSLQNATNKAEKEAKHEKGDKSPSKKNNIHSSFKKLTKDKPFMKNEEESRSIEIKENKKKKKSSKYRENVRKDSDSFESTKKSEKKDSEEKSLMKEPGESSVLKDSEEKFQMKQFNEKAEKKESEEKSEKKELEMKSVMKESEEKYLKIKSEDKSELIESVEKSAMMESVEKSAMNESEEKSAMNESKPTYALFDDDHVDLTVYDEECSELEYEIKPEESDTEEYIDDCPGEFDFKFLVAQRSNDNLNSPPPKTPEISNSPCYTDEVVAHQEDGSSSDSRIDEELIKNARRLEECMMANNDDSYGSNLSCSGSSSKGPHQTDLMNLLPKPLIQVVPTNFSENSLDSKPIANLCPQQRSYEEEAAIQSLKLQKELEKIDSKVSDTNSKTSFDPVPFSLFNSTSEKSIAEEHPFTNITPIVPKPKIPEIDNLFACNEIESKITNEEQIKCSDFSSEIDSQRKIEDDLAVAALLQDMNDPCSHDEPSNHEQATEIDEPSNHHSDSFLNIIVPRISDNDEGASAVHIDLSASQQIATPTSLSLSTDVTVADIAIDDQELKAAVQEIELSSDSPLVISKDAPLKPSPILIQTPILAEEEIMFNDDDEDIERELIVDESVLDKSLQDDSEDVNDTDVVVRNFSEVSKPLVSALDIQPFTFHSSVSEPIETDAFSLSKAKHMSMPILTATFETKKTMEPITSVFSFETKPANLVAADIKEARLSVDSDKESNNMFNNFLSPLSIATSETKKPMSDMFSESINSGDRRDTCSESGVSDKTEIEEETISESFEDSLSKFVGSDIAKEDDASLNDENVNKINVEEYNYESDSNNKSKRNRRTKNRKYSESSMQSPRSEAGSDSALSINTNLSASGIALLSPNSLSPSTYTTTTYSDISPGSKRKQQSQQHSMSTAYGIRRSVRSAAVAATVANTTTVLDELEENDFSLDETSINKDEHEQEDSGLKKPSKRGRKKKNSGNSEGSHKQPDTETPKKDRTPLSLNVTSNDIHPKSSNSPYDVFEFRDSDEDEPIILDSIKSSAHFMASVIPEEKRHPEPLSEAQPQAQANVLPVKTEPQVQVVSNTVSNETTQEINPANNSANLSEKPLSEKEYVSEVSEYLKLTIRLQSKDGQESIVNAPEVSKPKNLVTEDSKSNDGLSNQSTCSTSSLQDSSTAAANAKAVRKSPRLMCQLPKTTIEDTIEDVITKTIKKKESETDKATGLKRITRSVYRKSDDSSTLQQAQDSADDQEDSKNASLRTYRITRSRVPDSLDATESLSQSQPDNQITGPTNNNAQSLVHKKFAELSDSTELAFKTSTANESVANETPNEPILPTLDETTIKVENNDEVTPTINMPSETPKQQQPEPSPPSVIHSTGNVDKITASASVSTVSSVVTNVTSPPTLPTSSTTSIITTYLQDIPNISERIHHSSTALKLKTGKGLFIPAITSPGTETSTVMSSSSVALPSVSPSVISTTPIIPKISDGYLSPVTCAPTESSIQTVTPITQSQSITIKPKYQPPVGKPLISSVGEPWPSVPSTVSKSFISPAQTTIALTTSAVSMCTYSTPLSFSLTDSVKHQDALIQPPPAHTPKPLSVDSLKGLNMTTQSMPTSVVTSHQSPITDPVTPVLALSNSPKIPLSKSSGLQIAGASHAAHELSHLPYPQNPVTLSTESFATQQKEFINSFHKQQSAAPNQPPQTVTPELVQPNLSVISHIRPQVSPSSIGQSMMVPSQYMRPETLEALHQIMYMNSLTVPAELRNSQGICAPHRFIYPPGFGITPEAFVAAERQQELIKEQPKNPEVNKQKQIPHSVKSQKDEIQRQQQQMVEELKHSGQEQTFHVDAASMPPPPCNQLLRNYSPFMIQERYSNDPSLLYGPNGQGRNIVIPNQGFGVPSPTDLSKQIPPQSLTPEPMKRSPMHRQLPSPLAHSPAYRKELPSVVDPTPEMIRSQITGQFPKDLVSHSPLPLNMTSHTSQRPPSRPPAMHQIGPVCADQSVALVRRTSAANLVPEPPMINSPPLINSIPNPSSVEQQQQQPQKAQLVTSQDEMLCKYPVLLRGLLALKNDQASIQMHYVSGNVQIANRALYSFKENETLPIRITQRMRIDQTQLQGLERKIQSKDEHCILLVLPCGRDEGEVVQQSANLDKYFITYLQSKLAAGIVNTNDETCSYITHIFPTCDFSEEHLVRVAPDLLQTSQGFSHLMVVITN